MIGFRLRALALLLGIPTIVTAAAAQPSPPAPTASATASATSTASAAPSTSATSAASAAPSASSSADALAPSKEDRKRANELMDAGDEAITNGDLPSALDAYKKAHEIMHVPSTGIEVARTLDKLGQLLDALAAAREVAAIPATPGEPKPFTEAREAARTLAADLAARVPTLEIVVTGVRASTPYEVLLDGRKLTREELAAPIELPPGKHRVTARADEHTGAFADIELKERDRRQATLALARVLVVPPDPTTTTPPPTAQPAGISPLVPVGFAVGGAGLLVGVITGAVAISKANEANTLCPAGACRNETDRSRAQSAYGTADALAIVSDLAFVVTLGGAALGIYGLVSPPAPKPAPAATPSASFLLGPGGAGVRVRF